MSEKNLIINNREIEYHGVFKASDIFNTINKALEARGFGKREKRSEEVVTDEGRKTYIELRPGKIKTNYMAFMIKIKIRLDNVTDVVKETDGVKKKCEQGDVSIAFDSWLMSDYETRWGQKVLVYFMKGFINKYIYRWPMEKGYPGELASDTAYIYGQLKKLFDSYNGGKTKAVSEKEIMDQVGKEIEMERDEEE